MLDKLKTFYANHTMWVNIGGAIVVVLLAVKFLRKK